MTTHTPRAYWGSLSPWPQLLLRPSLHSWVPPATLRVLIRKTLLFFSYFILISGKQCHAVETCMAFGVRQPKHKLKSINFWLCDLEQMAHYLLPQLPLKNGDNNSTYYRMFLGDYNAGMYLAPYLIWDEVPRKTKIVTFIFNTNFSCNLNYYHKHYFSWWSVESQYSS